MLRLNCNKSLNLSICPIFLSLKILLDSVSECLRLAASKQHNSISFPAIGTGGLGFNKKEVAQVMSDAVANFAQKFPKKMDVYFVIFHYDNETFKVVLQKYCHDIRIMSLH